MPQIDRHKNRQVEIEFDHHQNLSKLPIKNRHTIVVITQGQTDANLNDYPIKLSSHTVLCLRFGDKLTVNNCQNLSACSFSFDPSFLNTVRLSQTSDIKISNTPRITEGLALFKNSPHQVNLIPLDSDIYPKFLQWFFTIGTEVSAQSDDLWVCRIKQYLIQIFNLLKQLKQNNQNSAVDLVLKYIHTNYATPIHSEDLTSLTHLNRVSLNEQFKKRLHQTALQYLLSYRLNIAEQMLTHTGMTLNDIALATGFEYDTYFMKQFKNKNSMSPSQYRNITRKIASAQ